VLRTTEAVNRERGRWHVSSGHQAGLTHRRVAASRVVRLRPGYGRGIAPEEETLDVELAIERLNAALELQTRAALQYSLTAASLVGFEVQAVGGVLTEYGDSELADARRLIEKIVALEGTPTTEVAELRVIKDPVEAIEWLIECETEAVDALQAAIEPTGREGRSEALEHLLEHLILRKQAQIDFLRRASKAPG
jgi:bacterioferritin (cytochrome b1)